MSNKPQLTFSFLSERREGRSPKCRPAVQLPIPALDLWDEPDTFHETLDLHMRRHGDNSRSLQNALRQVGADVDSKTIRTWRSGQKVPNFATSLRALAAIEVRYRLRKGLLKSKFCSSSRSVRHFAIEGVSPAEQRRLSWYLPDDFSERPQGERGEILNWVRTVIVSGATEYRRYQAEAMKHRYAIRFDKEPINAEALEHLDRIPGAIPATPALSEEMAQLRAFKTAVFAPLGYERSGIWGEETAAQKAEHLGLLFGALAASPTAAVRGLGVPVSKLTFALLLFPAVWDWYLQWRRQKRGFFTAWEVDMLTVASSLVRANTGWVRQSPHLAARLQPVAGLITEDEIVSATREWDASCERLYKYANARSREVQRIARVHRDPFEPVLAVLEASSPLGEYRKIADEILRLMPDETRYPIAKAEAVRSFLMIRLGLHLGIRQRNLRELLMRTRGQAATSERSLAERRRGELRWSERDAGWEVFIPAVAFKNKDSSFFRGKPLRMLLPNLAGLYGYLEEYMEHHRPRLLRHAADPGTFFVKTVKRSTVDAAYGSNSFYEAWRLITQRYGVYNPYTGRGAIRGLLPHGPHNVRDVLATHVLKATGSYEQASYAIQDTPEMVAKHYGRFLPQDKAALAAKVLNEAWAAE